MQKNVLYLEKSPSWPSWAVQHFDWQNFLHLIRHFDWHLLTISLTQLLTTCKLSWQGAGCPPPLVNSPKDQPGGLCHLQKPSSMHSWSKRFCIFWYTLCRTRATRAHRIPFSPTIFFFDIKWLAKQKLTPRHNCLETLHSLAKQNGPFQKRPFMISGLEALIL